MVEPLVGHQPHAAQVAPEGGEPAGIFMATGVEHFAPVEASVQGDPDRPVGHGQPHRGGVGAKHLDHVVPHEADAAALPGAHLPALERGEHPVAGAHEAHLAGPQAHAVDVGPGAPPVPVGGDPLGAAVGAGHGGAGHGHMHQPRLAGVEPDLPDVAVAHVVVHGLAKPDAPVSGDEQPAGRAEHHHLRVVRVSGHGVDHALGRAGVPLEDAHKGARPIRGSIEPVKGGHVDPALIMPVHLDPGHRGHLVALLHQELLEVHARGGQPLAPHPALQVRRLARQPQGVLHALVRRPLGTEEQGAGGGDHHRLPGGSPVVGAQDLAVGGADHDEVRIPVAHRHGGERVPHADHAHRGDALGHRIRGHKQSTQKQGDGGAAPHAHRSYPLT